MKIERMKLAYTSMHLVTLIIIILLCSCNDNLSNRTAKELIIQKYDLPKFETVNYEKDGSTKYTYFAVPINVILLHALSFIDLK